ncbi:MAG: DNA replication protein [Rhodospirillaceae bacterium]|nr:DNA replication protein [Rhodospirillaceae bacterium]
MSPDRQLVFDLSLRPALGRADFYVGPANFEAVAWIDRWPDWPQRALAIFGPPGCGKSHLVQVFAARAAARVVAAADLRAAAIGELLATSAALAVEDCDGLVDERALLHALNLANELGRSLVMTAREPPARWPVALPDLRSRLAAVPAAGIDLPDDAMIEAVLVKLFADRQLIVAPDVVTYVTRRMDRSFDAARQLVAAADRRALAAGTAVTIPLVRTLLD